MHGFTSQQNEFFALLFLLYTAHNIGIKNIVAVGDSKLVIQAMTNIINLKHSRLMSIQKDIQSISNSFHEVSFARIPSEKNRKAHNLAQMGAQKKFSLLKANAKKPDESESSTSQNFSN